MGNKAWTEKEIEELVELWKAGMRAQDIAVLINRTAMAVETKVNRLLGNNSRKKLIPPKRQQFWNVVRVGTLRRMWCSDCSVHEIAEYLKLSDTAVRHAAFRLLGADYRHRVNGIVRTKEISPHSQTAIDVEHEAWYKMAKERNKAKRDVLETKWRKLNEAL